MTVLQRWLHRPCATIRFDTAVEWPGWTRRLRGIFLGRRRALDGSRLEVLDRLSLGGKRSLTLVAAGGRQILVASGESDAPSMRELRPRAASAARKGSGSRRGPSPRTLRRGSR
jgi:hypothetical protein